MSDFSVINIVKNFGSSVGGESVTINGTGFISGIKAKFDGIEGTNVSFAGPNNFSIKTPAGSSGYVDVVVINQGGETFTLSRGFRYVCIEAPTELLATYNVPNITKFSDLSNLFGTVSLTFKTTIISDPFDSPAFSKRIVSTKIFRATSQSGPYVQIGTGNTGSFTDSTITKSLLNHFLYYKIKSVTTDGSESGLSEEVYTVTSNYNYLTPDGPNGGTRYQNQYNFIYDSVTKLKLTVPRPFYGPNLFYDKYIEEIFDFLKAELNNTYKNISNKPKLYVYFNCEVEGSKLVGTGKDADLLKNILCNEPNTKIYQLEYKSSKIARIKNSKVDFISLYLRQIQRLLNGAKLGRMNGFGDLLEDYKSTRRLTHPISSYLPVEQLKTIEKDCNVSDWALNNVRPTYPAAVITTDRSILYLDLLRAKVDKKTSKESYLGKFSILYSDNSRFAPSDFNFHRTTVGTFSSTAGIFIFHSGSDILITDINLNPIGEDSLPLSISEIVSVERSGHSSPSSGTLITYLDIGGNKYSFDTTTRVNTHLDVDFKYSIFRVSQQLTDHLSFPYMSPENPVTGQFPDGDGGYIGIDVGGEPNTSKYSTLLYDNNLVFIVTTGGKLYGAKRQGFGVGIGGFFSGTSHLGIYPLKNHYPPGTIFYWYFSLPSLVHISDPEVTLQYQQTDSVYSPPNPPSQPEGFCYFPSNYYTVYSTFTFSGNSLKSAETVTITNKVIDLICYNDVFHGVDYCSGVFQSYLQTYDGFKVNKGSFGSITFSINNSNAPDFSPRFIPINNSGLSSILYVEGVTEGDVISFSCDPVSATFNLGLVNQFPQSIPPQPTLPRPNFSIYNLFWGLFGYEELNTPTITAFIETSNEFTGLGHSTFVSGKFSTESGVESVRSDGRANSGEIPYFFHDYKFICDFDSTEFSGSDLSIDFCPEPFIKIKPSFKDLTLIGFFPTKYVDVSSPQRMTHEEIIVLGEPNKLNVEKSKSTIKKTFVSHGIGKHTWKLENASKNAKITSKANTAEIEVLVSDHHSFFVKATDDWKVQTCPKDKEEVKRVTTAKVRVWPRTVPNSNIVTFSLLGGDHTFYSVVERIDNGLPAVVQPFPNSISGFGGTVGKHAILFREEQRNGNTALVTGKSLSFDVFVWSVEVNGTGIIPNKFTIPSGGELDPIKLNILGTSSYPHEWAVSDDSVAHIFVDPSDSAKATLKVFNEGLFFITVQDSARIPFRSSSIQVVIG